MPPNQKRSRTECPEIYENGSCTRCLEGGFDCVLDRLTRPVAKEALGNSTRPNVINILPDHESPIHAPRHLPSVPTTVPSSASAFLASSRQTSARTTPNTVSNGQAAQPSPSDIPLASPTSPEQTDFMMDAFLSLRPLTPPEWSLKEPQPASGNSEAIDDMFILPSLFSPPAPAPLGPPEWMDQAIAEQAQGQGYGMLSSIHNKHPEKDALTMFYHHVILSWFSTLPERLQRTLIEHYSEISELHEVTRAARNAVSSGTVHFKRGHPRIDNLIPPECRACEPDPESAYRNALQMLKKTENEPGLTLESKLWAIMDMQLFELVYHGAKQAHAMLATADDLIRAAFGPSPSLDLASLKGYSTFSLRVFALADVVRSIALRVPTTFKYAYRASERDLEAVAYDNFLGLPQSLCVLMASVCNLCAQTWDSDRTPEVIEMASTLEEKIRAWRPLTFELEDHITSAAWVERVSMQECWRLSAIILIHTLVLRVGPLHPVVRDCVNQIIGLLKTSLTLSDLLEPAAVDIPACFSVCPAFLAGTLAIQPEDRQLCKHYIEACGPEAVWEGNIRVLDLTWAASDSAGHPVDWLLCARRANLVVAFF